MNTMDDREREEPGEPEEPPLFHAPEPPPIPEVLRGPITGKGKDSAGSGSGYSDMNKAWGVAMDFVFTILGSALLGYFADRWFHTGSALTLTGLGLGFAIALVRIIHRTMADERREREARESRKSGS